MEQGRILDGAGNVVDPCAYYRRRNPSAPCPSNAQPNPNATNYISVGLNGVPDIISIGTLLEAAGVASLDTNGVPSSETLRYGGLTLVVQLTYDNTFTTDFMRARYSFKVQAIPGKVKGVFSTSSTGAVPATSRYTFERSGIRVVLVFAGTVGKPDFTAAWTAAMSIATALTIAGILTTQLVTYFLTLSPVYSRYMTATTHDLSAFTTKDQLAAVKKAFVDNEHILDPTPAELVALAQQGAQPAGALTVRAEAGTAPDAVTAAYASAK
jgi:hypothetical protein